MQKKIIGVAIMAAIACIFFLYACVSKNEIIAEKELFFDDENNFEFTYEKIIFLETSSDCLINQIKQLEIVNDKIFILDIFELYVFDLNGKYIQTLGKRGSGPEEYISPLTFNIDKSKNTISIFDHQLNAYIVYDLNSYKFIKKKTIPFQVDDMCFMNDGNFLFLTNVQDRNGENTFHFNITNSNFKIINSYIHIDFSSGHMYPPFKNIYNLAGNTYGFIRFNNIIYKIETNKITPKYSLKFKNYKFPPIELLEKETESAFNKNYYPWLSESGYIISYNIIETDSALCVDYLVNKDRYFGFYNKQTNQIYHYEMKQFQEISGIYGIESIVGKSYDNCFVSIVYPYMIKNQVESNTNNLIKSKIAIDNINADDNPILFLFKF
ncbi:hypothetical protein AGMMS49574_29330 [Bacteroidia bacterium]|nr:hypothetical protein AGMMS49574_29330 [Bacteroidia bacterium]